MTDNPYRLFFRPMKLPNSSLCRGLLVTALSLFAFAAVAPASTFEGKVHMEITTSKKKEKMGMDYTMKDGKVRVDPQMPEHEGRGGMGGMGMIMDIEAREMIILMDMNGRKMYMRRPIPQPTAEQTAKAREGRDGHPISPPVATGRTEMIAGYKASEYKMTGSKGEIIELWLAKGLGPFMSMAGGNPMAGRGTPPPGWESFARDGNAFPMRVVSHDADGAETMRMEVTSIDKTPVSDSLFSTEGYSEFSFPGGMNPFGGH